MSNSTRTQTIERTRVKWDELKRVPKFEDYDSEILGKTTVRIGQNLNRLQRRLLSDITGETNFTEENYDSWHIYVDFWEMGKLVKKGWTRVELIDSFGMAKGYKDTPTELAEIGRAKRSADRALKAANREETKVDRAAERKAKDEETLEDLKADMKTDIQLELLQDEEFRKAMRKKLMAEMLA